MDNFTSSTTLYDDFDFVLAENASEDAGFVFFSGSTVHPNIHRPVGKRLMPPSMFGVISVMFKVVYVVGILGNLGAIFILRTGERRVRNRKHLLLLTTLAANDLIALVGMLTALFVSENVPHAAESQVYCAARVVLRVFGIGSVCIAVTMALERYLALTRPFLYHKQVTYFVIRTALLVSWIVAALLTCAPILGWGAYWNQEHLECTRYKNPRNSMEFAYAVVYISFGMLLCIILVYCNVAVIIALLAISSPRAGAPAVRRVSRRSCPRAQPQTFAPSAATAEEVAFSRLMAMLSFLFMCCWMPQMATSALYLAMDNKYWSKLGIYSMMSDLLMLMNYVLNPILYVLWRRWRVCSHRSVWRAIATCCKQQRHKSSTDSTKAAHCLQDTLLTSESSGAEMRPLRTRIVLTAPAGHQLLP